jgi:2-polyprenyl-6-methoxyphenol hydroxylase-like FAD-dependent oxidoreductase
MQHEVTDLIFENDRVAGVRVKTPEGARDLRADLVIGADGRHAVTHTRGNFELLDFGVPIDVLWMRIPKLASDPSQTLGFFRNGRLLVLIDRADYFQAAMIIPKGRFEAIKQRGLSAFQQDIVALAPFLADRITRLNDWSKIRLLTVQINRLRHWCRDGLLCIGDCAHAMSPAGGVGINLALQDAVATANLLAAKLKTGPVSLADLEQVQKRREWPTRLIQRVQVFIHRRITVPSTDVREDDSLPFLVRFLQWFPVLRRIPARLIGLGPRREHIHSPAANSAESL